MKNPLRCLARALCAALLLLVLPMTAARASHIQGGQISYSYIGPGAGTTDRYQVTVTYFRDCSGIGLPSAVTLQATRGSACNTTPAVTVMLQPVGSPIIGTPYCGRVQQSATCSSSSPVPLYQYQDYTGNVDLQPAPEWTLSAEDCCRPDLANIAGNTGFRFEAKLFSLQVPVPGPGIAFRNNSPRFSSLDLPVPFVPVNSQSTVSFAATEPDGDSLVYSLEAPLTDCGINSVYVARQGNTACVPRNRPTCNFVCPTSNGPTSLFSPELPLPVGYDTTLCNNGTRTLTPRFNFDPQTGLMVFTPNRFFNTPGVLGQNKYVVVCNISEFRRLNNSNRRVLVGSARRDFLVTVITGTPNSNPLPPVTALDSASIGGNVNQNSIAQVTRIVVNSCNFSQANINFTDPDNQPTPGFPNGQGQLLTITYTGAVPIAELLQNGNIGTATLRNNGTPTPTLQLSFQPDPSFAGRVLRLPFRIEDDNCPIKGVQQRIIEIEVRDGRRVQARPSITSPGLTPGSPVTICPGGSATLAGAVAAVDSIRQRVNGTTGAFRTVAQTYEYRWFAPNRATAGLPAVVTGATITVRPTVTTRYTLFANPNPLTSPYSVNNQGFSVCGDSSSINTGVSILVRVVPEPVVRITAAPDTVVCAGTAVTLTGTASRADNIPDTYSYRYTGPGVPAATTTASYTFTARTSGVYRLTATGDPRFGCDGGRNISIRVVPNAIANFTVDSVGATGSNATRLKTPVTYTFTNRSTSTDNAVPFTADTVRYTYQLVRDYTGRAITGQPEITFARGTSARAAATLTLLDPGYYIVRLRTANAAPRQQCTSLFARTIYVPFYDVPNIITPNGDRQNDTFIINGNQLGSKLEIYNRWGRKMQEYGNYQNQWGAEGEAPGVYYYLLTDKNGTTTKGWIEVVK